MTRSTIIYAIACAVAFVVAILTLTGNDMATCEAHHSTITCLHSLTP